MSINRMRIQINSIVDGVPTGVDLDTGNEAKLLLPPRAIAILVEAIDMGIHPVFDVAVEQ